MAVTYKDAGTGMTIEQHLTNCRCHPCTAAKGRVMHHRHLRTLEYYQRHPEEAGPLPSAYPPSTTTTEVVEEEEEEEEVLRAPEAAYKGKHRAPTLIISIHPTEEVPIKVEEEEREPTPWTATSAQKRQWEEPSSPKDWAKEWSPAPAFVPSSRQAFEFKTWSPVSQGQQEANDWQEYAKAEGSKAKKPRASSKDPQTETSKGKEPEKKEDWRIPKRTPQECGEGYVFSRPGNPTRNKRKESEARQLARWNHRIDNLCKGVKPKGVSLAQYNEASRLLKLELNQLPNIANEIIPHCHLEYEEKTSVMAAANQWQKLVERMAVFREVFPIARGRISYAEGYRMHVRRYGRCQYGYNRHFAPQHDCYPCREYEEKLFKQWQADLVGGSL